MCGGHTISVEILLAQKDRDMRACTTCLIKMPGFSCLNAADVRIRTRMWSERRKQSKYLMKTTNEKCRGHNKSVLRESCSGIVV